MKPDEKYMRFNDASNREDNDLVLVPFNVESPFTSVTAGFVPVYATNPDLGNSPFFNTGTNQFPQPSLPNINTPNMSNPSMNNPNMSNPSMNNPGIGNPNNGIYNNMNNNMSNSLGNTNSSTSPNTSKNNYDLWSNQSTNNNQNSLKSYNNSTPPKQNTSDNNPNKYPSDISSDTLYSYNSSENRFPDVQEIVSMLNIPYDEDNSGLDRDGTDKKINNIYETIEKNYSEIIKTLESYKIPLPVSKLIVRKIIRISVKYSKKEGE